MTCNISNERVQGRETQSFQEFVIRFVFGWNLIIAVLAIGSAATSVAPACAQALGDSLVTGPHGADSVNVAIFVDGRAVGNVQLHGLDSLEAHVEAIVDSIRSVGRYHATIDSVTGNGVYISEGPVVRVGRVEIVGVGESEADLIRENFSVRVGRVLDAVALEEDLRRTLTRYDALGYPLAAARIEEIEPIDGGSIRVVIGVEPGPQLRLDRIELPGAPRMSASFVSRLIGLRTGVVLERFEPEAIHRRLEETGLFETVGWPELIIEPDSAAVLVIPLEEAEPGSFDVVIGYLPAQAQGEKGSFIGNGHLELRNLLGGGRRLAIQLNRMPNQVSSLDLSAADPFFVGLPLALEGRFQGLEQDSTYGKQSYQAEVAYRFEEGVSAFTGFSREVTRPGQAGLRYAANGRQIVPRSDAWFVGLGARMFRVDRRINPRSGYLFEMNLESGRKEFIERRIAETDTTHIMQITDQRRLRTAGRLFAPTLRRQVLVVGVDAGLLLSDVYDRSDLFRFGGATSLRGYDEDRFMGRIVVRGLAEYRLQIDRNSYAYVFFDLGYVDRPAAPDLLPGRDFHPGYGAGIQFRTAVGLVNVSAAFNPESGPTEARIHAGLSFGL